MTSLNPSKIVIPTQNSADNNYIQDIVGNKTDTIAGDSVVAINKQIKAKTDLIPADPAETSDITTAHSTTDGKIDVIDAFHDVPSADSADNVVMSDVIGSKTDTEAGNSLYSNAYRTEAHFHSISYVYPSLANDPQIVAGDSGAWAEGAKVEIVPASTIANPFDLHYFALSAISAAGIFQINFYKGGAGSEVLIAQKKFAKGTNNEPLISQPLQTELLPANTRISASLACLAGTAKTVNVSICYHIY